MIIKQQVAFGVAVLLTAVLSGSVPADLPKSSGDASVKPIPQYDPTLDNDPLLDLNQENTTISTVTITEDDITPGDTGPIIDAFFTIEGLTHSHLSDLTVRVRHRETNRVATLFERVGLVDFNNNGGIDNQNLDGIGDDSDLSGSYRFRDGGSSLWDVAENTANGDEIPVLITQDNSFLPVYAASGSSNGEVGLYAIFGTDDSGTPLTLESVIGNWDFEISDRSSETTDTLVDDQEGNPRVQSFTRTNVYFATEAVAIPEPATASGILLGLVGLATRRRRA